MIEKDKYFISIQEEDFNIQVSYENISKKSSCGAYIHFIGRVRDFYIDENNHKKPLQEMYLECYDKMAYKQISSIIEKALLKFKVEHISLIHRKGLLKTNEQIVFIGVASHHRKDSFRALEYVIDYLKVKAPFWKKEISNTSSHWVKQNPKDIESIKS